MRTGNPCSGGSGSPFMPIARMALRSSSSTASGVDAVKPSTLRESTMSASAVGRRPREELADRVAEPHRVADESAADLVRDAGEGRDALLEGEGEQLIPREGHLPVDHAVDAQAPARRVHRRHGERRVDAVELRVRRDDGAQPLDVQLRRRRHGRGRRRRGKRDAVPDRAHGARTCLQRVPARCGEGAEHGRAARPREEAAAVGAAVGRGWRRGGKRGRQWSQRPSATDPSARHPSGPTDAAS